MLNNNFFDIANTQDKYASKVSEQENSHINMCAHIFLDTHAHKVGKCFATL